MQSMKSSVEGRVHLAVIDAHFARLMLDGVKTIESRLSKTRRSPFGVVSAGERVYFLSRRAGLIVTAVVSRVEQYEGLDARGVARLAAQYGESVAADAGYWHARREARYASLLWLRDIERAAYAPDDVHGRERSYRSAWFVRPAQQDVYPRCCDAVRVCA